jgi:Uncharacterised protein family (UPF0137)
VSETSVFQNKAFHTSSQTGVGFNLAPQINNFQSVFNTKPLDPKESNRIEKLLVENFQPGKISEEQVVKDVEHLKLITSEIRAIGKQGTVLMGERVYKARFLLKPYKDGTFSKWLESTFGTRKTGYNMLAYHELYTALPDEALKDNLKKLPQRTAYILASRKGDIQTKAEIISEHHSKGHDELLSIIQDKFPIASQDRRTGKSANRKLIALIKKSVLQLQKHKDALTHQDRVELEHVSGELRSLSNV